MAAGRTRTSERFTHVANLMLRGVLVSKPEHVTPGEMRQALRRTLDGGEFVARYESRVHLNDDGVRTSDGWKKFDFNDVLVASDDVLSI
jgi:hypothetical protein